MSKVKNPWIVELKASFQEDDYLYLIMEFLPGGDLMNLLIKKDILTEDEARFYIAELILSIESIHKLDCIHRDIKPDNILIDKNGHIKLSDFGLAKISEKLFERNYNSFIINNNLNKNEFENNKHEKNYSCVGTAYYVAPEVLIKKGYGPEIDWWSVGVIFFEMLFGYAPFCSKETSEVCYKVLHWKNFLKIPSKIKISREAEDLIAKLINNSNKRLGLNGADEIKSHPFFNGLDWDNIHNLKAPFIPELKNEYDTHYFDNFKIKEPFYPPVKKNKKRKDIEYLGYTFKDDPKNNISIFNEFQIAVQKYNTKENNNNHLTSNDTYFVSSQCQTKTSSKLNEIKTSSNKNINNNKNKNLELNSKTEPNIDNGIINGLDNYLSNNEKAKDNNYKKEKEEKLLLGKNKKSLDKKEVKLNIIQLPNKKLTNQKGIKTQRNNNKLTTIKNVIKNNNYKLININKSKNNSLKKNNIKINQKFSRSNPKPIQHKLSPSPNQKNIFLKKYVEKNQSKQKDSRGISGNNIRNTSYNKINLIKKPINQNAIKKILGKNKSTSIKKVNNNSIRNGKIVIFNKNIKKTIKKNINIVNLKNSNEILNQCERDNSPSTKITFIYKKTE